MLSDRFLTRLEDAFPHFYERVNAEAVEEARLLLKEAGGDVQQALVRARFKGAGRIWWPYLQGSLPLVGKDLPAMEAFTRLILTVDHVVGYQPPTMTDARRQVLHVLHQSLDVERLKTLVGRGEKEEAKAAAAGAGLAAGMSALMAPLTAFRSARKWTRLVPPPLRITLAAVVVAALLSIPLLAGYSAGQHAETAARNYGEVPKKPKVKGEDPRIRA